MFAAKCLINLTVAQGGVFVAASSNFTPTATTASSSDEFANNVFVYKGLCGTNLTVISLY